MAKGLLYGAGAAAAAVTERRGTTAVHVFDWRQPCLPLPAPSSCVVFELDVIDLTRTRNQPQFRNRTLEASMEPLDEYGEAPAISGSVAAARNHPHETPACAIRRSLRLRARGRRAQRSPWGVEELPATIY